MNVPRERISVSGAGMDVARPRRRRPWGRIAAASLAGAGILAVAVWSLVPHGLTVDGAAIRRGQVQRTVFHDDLVVRANAESENSVMLDAIESGRVEEVLARDGALVAQGDLLFRLSNAQRRMDLLQRQSERAQQLSNLANLEVTYEVAQNQHAQQIVTLRYDLEQAEKQLVRNTELAARGFLSAASLEETRDRVAQQRHRVALEEASLASESSVRRGAMNKMAGAIEGLDSGLRLANATVGALSVRAPASGRLTDFNLKVGEAVRADQRLGHIDAPRFKLTAQVDEYFLNRVALKRQGTARVNGQAWPVEVSRVYAQVKDRRFTVELVFTGKTPDGLQPGMSVDASITLGEPAPALVLPNGPWMNDSGGAWVFLVSADGGSAQRRAIRTGRRNDSQVEISSGLAAGDTVILSSYAPYGSAERLHID